MTCLLFFSKINFFDPILHDPIRAHCSTCTQMLETAQIGPCTQTIAGHTDVCILITTALLVEWILIRKLTDLGIYSSYFTTAFNPLGREVVPCDI